MYFYKSHLIGEYWLALIFFRDVIVSLFKDYYVMNKGRE
jgi:hypothetical protein